MAASPSHPRHHFSPVFPRLVSSAASLGSGLCPFARGRARRATKKGNEAHQQFASCVCLPAPVQPGFPVFFVSWGSCVLGPGAFFSLVFPHRRLWLSCVSASGAIQPSFPFLAARCVFPGPPGRGHKARISMSAVLRIISCLSLVCDPPADTSAAFAFGCEPQPPPTPFQPSFP